MESGKPIAPQIEDTKDNDAERQDKLKAFKEVQLERCKDMFLLVHQRPEFFDEWFWGSSIVAVEDGGVICLGCGDFAMCSPGSMAVVEAHLIRKHKRRDTSASVDGVVMPSRSQPDGFRMPASYDECPTAEKVLDVALTSQEVLTAWRFHTQSAYGYAGAMRSVAAGVLCRSVFDGDPMVREPAAKGLVARRPKMIKPKVAGTGGFVDDGLIDGIRLPGKNDLHNKQWHVKEMVRWYDVSRAKAEELYSNGVRQGWPGSSLLGEDYKFTTWDMCCMVCYQQRGRVVHSVSAPSMDSHLSGREHKKSLDCMGDGSPNNNNYSSSSTVIVPVVKANTAAITVVDKDELPPAGDPHQKEWHVAQMVKWYEESVEGASALYDAGVRQGWPGCKLLGDAYCPSEWEMICYVCFSQSEKVAKGMHPDTMRQHLGGKAHKNNVMWSKGEWQGGSGSRGGGGENKGSYMGGLTWAAPARPHKARLEQYLAGERLKQQPVVSPERALPEEESRQAAESMNAERNACESFRQHAGECSQCSRYPHATVNCWYFTDHFDGDGCKDCLMLLFRTRSKRPLPESSSSKSSSSELTPPLPLSPRRRTHAGIAATKAARVDGGGGQMGSGG
ncbi:hypothetical protein FOL47_003119 [Perkinsus chesapeaki]|uniref:Uncharacterized protein n=1 Tax=Perkinsus chesapeaki TaxID=330153 RepID=A0A7J6M9Q7_PERCH|nr:hypothetical protein FOL47_003119 [Perkinsus chesapeaki]